MELLCGDCLELMAGIPDGSVDAIICDLPYGTTACKWDTVIPFEPLWRHYKRAIKRNGAIVLFGSQPFTTLLIGSNLPMFKYGWVWCKSKGTGFLNAKNAPIKMHEDILVFSNGATANRSVAPMPYYPQGLVPYHRIRRNTAQGGSTIGTRPSRTTNYKQEYQGYPSTVLTFPNDSQHSLHPTQKPVVLLEYLIRTYTNEGETVLDNTMGSGTTGVACVNTDRDFIGIERDQGYFEIAQKRIQEAQSKARQLPLDLAS